VQSRQELRRRKYGKANSKFPVHSIGTLAEPPRVQDNQGSETIQSTLFSASPLNLQQTAKPWKANGS
jgi:hypothetical protein